MEIQVNEKEYCKLEVHYEADKDQIDNKRVEVLSMFKRAPVPGFRDGKANLEVIKIHYKKQIEEALKRALAEEAFHNTMFEKNVKPLGQPNFSSMLLQGNKFTCDFSINKRPDFELAQYKDLEIPKPPRDVSVDELTERMMEELRTQYGTMNPYSDDDFVQEGDKIIIAYEAKMDGVRQDSLSTDGEPLTVGANPLKEFDQNLLGMKQGETRQFSLLVPENGLPSYRGKTIDFTATVSVGSKVEKMPLDDTLAQKIGRPDYNSLREEVTARASAQVSEGERSRLVQQIGARLVDSHSFEVPHWLSLSEAQYLAANARKEWDTLPDEDKESFLKLAERNVKLALILDKIRENEPEAQLSDQELIEMIKQNIAKSNSNIDEVLESMNKTGYLPVLVARLRDETTLDFLLKTVKQVE